MLGEEISVLVNEPQKEGMHQINFNANNLTSGVYFYMLTAQNGNGQMLKSVKKMIILK